MADYYHTARAAKKQIENTQKENKRNRERNAELRGDTGQNVEHPLNALSIEGRPVKIHATSLEHHSGVNRMDGLIPWNGDPDNLIDRFDCRCMLDFYREPASASTNEHVAAGDPKLLQLVQFEAFRDLVKYASKGLPEEVGIEAAQEESLAIRAQARVEATAAFRIQSHQALPGDAAMAAGSGPYSAVGFQYGGAGAEESDSSSSSSGSDDSGSDDNADPRVREEEDAQDVMDEAAEAFGITNYSWRLHRALTQEGEEDAKRRMPRKRSNRKRARARARRLAGMGLDPRGQSLLNWHDPLATNAPSAHLVSVYGSLVCPSAAAAASAAPASAPAPAAALARSQPETAASTPLLNGKVECLRPRRPSPDTRSRSRSPTRRARHDPLGALRELPTRPSTHTIDRKAFERDDNIIDALPDMPDPAMSGPQPFPAASALQNIRLQQEQQRRERERDRDYRRRSRSRSRDRYRRRSPSPSTKSSSRYRSSRRSRSRSRDRSRYHRRSPSSSRSRSPRRRRGEEESVSERLKSVPPPAKAAAPETPAERMKRIIAAQLNKQSSTDSMKGLNKKR